MQCPLSHHPQSSHQQLHDSLERQSLDTTKSWLHRKINKGAEVPRTHSYTLTVTLSLSHTQANTKLESEYWNNSAEITTHAQAHTEYRSVTISLLTIFMLPFIQQQWLTGLKVPTKKFNNKQQTREVIPSCKASYVPSLIWDSVGSIFCQTHKRFKRMLFIRTEHNRQIFRVIHCIRLQKDT